MSALGILITNNETWSFSTALDQSSAHALPSLLPFATLPRYFYGASEIIAYTGHKVRCVSGGRGGAETQNDKLVRASDGLSRGPLQEMTCENTSGWWGKKDIITRYKL